MSKNEKLQIRSSAAEFLIFESQKQEKGVEVITPDLDPGIDRDLDGIELEDVADALENLLGKKTKK